MDITIERAESSAKLIGVDGQSFDIYTDTLGPHTPLVLSLPTGKELVVKNIRRPFKNDWGDTTWARLTVTLFTDDPCRTWLTKEELQKGTILKIIS